MGLIQQFVAISLQDPTISSINITHLEYKSLTLGYPCSNKHICSAYIIDVQPGKYRFECWGSRGTGTHNLQAGYGGYTSGDIVFHSPKRLFVYVGNPGYFNALKYLEVQKNEGHPGGATDVRLEMGNKWWDMPGLISRIMVAGGGGGCEFHASVGGNAGGINGGQSLSGTSNIGDTTFKEPCPGAKQTSGAQCPSYTINQKTYKPTPGEFGASLDPTSSLTIKDYGGIGGGGYYGGTSYPYAFAGSGGSSFISGHKGCNSVENNADKITHTGSSIHYSGIFFTNTKMIEGSKSMPLPTSSSNGIYFGSGSFRITLLAAFTKRAMPHQLHLFLIF